MFAAAALLLGVSTSAKYALQLKIIVRTCTLPRRRALMPKKGYAEAAKCPCAASAVVKINT